MSQNIVLQIGDLVFIPERLTLGRAEQFLNIFSLIRILFGGW
jgi:hypothetical protein